MNLRWSPTASSDLEEIRDYIAADDPKTAARILVMIVEAVGRLSSFPQLGRAGRVKGTRELAIPGTPFMQHIESTPRKLS